jgi:hypothetical protein
MDASTEAARRRAFDDACAAIQSGGEVGPLLNIADFRRPERYSTLLRFAVAHGHTETLDWLASGAMNRLAFTENIFRSAMYSDTQAVLPWLTVFGKRAWTRLYFEDCTIGEALSHENDCYYLWLRSEAVQSGTLGWRLDSRLIDACSKRGRRRNVLKIILPNGFAAARYWQSIRPDVRAALLETVFSKGTADKLGLLMSNDCVRMRAAALADSGRLLRLALRNRRRARQWRRCLRLTPSDLVSAGLLI